MSPQRNQAEAVDEREPVSPVRDYQMAQLRHQLSNNLQIILALIAKESAKAKEPQVKAALQRLADKVQELTPPHEPVEQREGRGRH